MSAPKLAIANIPPARRTHLLCDAVFIFVALKVLVWFRVVLAEFLHDVLAYIAVVLLDLRRNFHVLLRGNAGHLSTFTEKVEHELRNVAASDWDVLDSTANNIAFSAGNDVR